MDTGVFVRWERRGQSIDQRLFQLDRPAYISVVTASELLVGVHRADSPTRRETRSRFVEALLASVCPPPNNALSRATSRIDVVPSNQIVSQFDTLDNGRFFHSTSPAAVNPIRLRWFPN